MTGSAAIGDTPIFSNLDLTLKPQSWTCLLGASGVGKSTVLRLFAGLAEGVTFDGALSDPGRVAMMAQQDLLMPWLSWTTSCWARGCGVPARIIALRVTGWHRSDWRITRIKCHQPYRVANANASPWHAP